MIPASCGITYVEDVSILPFMLGASDFFRLIERADGTLRAPLEIEHVH